MSTYAVAIKNLYLAGKITYQNLVTAQEKNLITSEEFNKILALKPEES